jgi:transcriptional regulator with XRE-family HTH domain
MSDEKKKTNEFDKIIGTNVRNKRLTANLSREKVAAAFSQPITHQQLEKYESGKNRLTGGKIYELSVFFNCPVGELYEGCGELINGATLSTELPSKRELHMVKNYRAIEQDDVQEVVSRLVNTVACHLKRE